MKFKVITFLGTLHCKSFSCSCLTVSKNSSIISFKNTFDNRKSSLLKNARLLTRGSKNSIESKVLSGRKTGLFWVGILNCYPSDSLININNQLMISFDLITGWRSTSDNDLNCLCLRTNSFGWHNLNYMNIFHKISTFPRQKCN